MELLQKVLEMVQKPEVMMILGFAVEMLMRLIPSQKPWSIMHAAKRIIRAVAQACGVFADIMDKILPQNVVEPVLEVPKQ